LTLTIVFFIVHCVVLCYALYKLKAPKVLKAFALSFLVLTGAVTMEHYLDNVGAPIKGYPDKFIYVHHRIIGDVIELWVHVEGTGPRLYTFPYTQEAAEELQEAKEKSEEGVEQEGEFTDADGDPETPPSPVIDDWKGDDTTERKD